MKRLIVMILILCFVSSGCEKGSEGETEAVDARVVKQRYIGRFKENISLYRQYQDKLIIQKEQGESFDVYSLDINSPVLKLEYTIKPQNKLLYCMQLDAANILKVKQLGNSEEDNVLLLEGKSTKSIAKYIGYSDSALVELSPSQQYLIYCAADSSLNIYGLYLYNMKSEQTLQLIYKVNDELLNDLEENIVWSPEEDYVAIMNKQIFSTKNGKLTREINAEKVVWSTNGSKLAYTRSDKGYGKSIMIFNLRNFEEEEVFITNSGEYLPGYMVWNDHETRLAFVTAKADTVDAQEDINKYEAIYSLDLTEREAIRVDTALNMSEDAVEKLESIHYNAAGNLIALTTTAYSGTDLYVYKINTGESKFYFNMEYLHHENNESYVCSMNQDLYFVKGQQVIRLDDNLSSSVIFQAADAVEDIYLSKDGSSIIVVELAKKEVILRQLTNFVQRSL